MVMKEQKIKSISFIKVSQEFKMTKYSQAFIGDLSGDQIDDILFNNEDAKAGGKLQVAIFNTKLLSYDVANFKETMVDPDCNGYTS